MNVDSNSIISILAMCVSVGTMVINIINHTKCTSRCCGKKGTVSLDIDRTGVLDSGDLEEPLRGTNSIHTAIIKSFYPS